MLMPTATARDASLMWPIGLQVPKCYTAHQSSAKFSSLLFKGLSPALKVVFVLRDIEEHSLRETSEILNLTETTVKTRLSRARLQLREDLSKYFKKPEYTGKIRAQLSVSFPSCNV